MNSPYPVLLLTRQDKKRIWQINSQPPLTVISSFLCPQVGKIVRQEIGEKIKEEKPQINVDSHALMLYLKPKSKILNKYFLFLSIKGDDLREFVLRQSLTLFNLIENKEIQAC